jgi:DNA-binding MarR family transcriptional regulator
LRLDSSIERESGKSSPGKRVMQREADNKATTHRQPNDGKTLEGLLALHSDMEARKTDWRLVSVVAASPRKQRILRALSRDPLDQRNLAKICSLQRANAQRTLRDLCTQGLVRCLTPERARAKIYALTPLGKRVYGRTGTARSADVTA